MVPFEITPRYICDMRTPYNMQLSLPHAKEVKLVLILRDPTPRAWSAFFQSVWQRFWQDEVYEEVVSEEMSILRACYNHTIGMSFMEPVKGAKGGPWLNRCRDPHAMYRELQTCANAHRSDVHQPWFYRFTLDPRALSPDGIGHNASDMYEGVAMRGIYADQILNYLCAGFRPEQILVITNGELASARAARLGVWCRHPNWKWEKKSMAQY